MTNDRNTFAPRKPQRASALVLGKGLAAARCAVALGVLAACVPVALAQGGPLKVGLVLAKQGFAAELGTATAEGAELALQQFPLRNPQRSVEIVWYDEPNPQAAQQNFTKLVQQDKVHAVIGGTTSGTALAMSAAAMQAKVPLVVPGATAREITGKDCNRYTFRVAPPVPTAATALAPVMLEHGKNWYFVVASYAYGQDVHKSMERELLKAGGKSLGVDVVPGGTTDFSAYILKIRQAKPSIVVLGVGGSDINAFIKQYTEFGMNASTPVIAPFVSDGQMWALGERANGLFGKAWHYSDAGNSDAEKKFAAAYEAKYRKPPLVEAWQGWTAMRMVLGALEPAGPTDGKALVGRLEALKVDNGGESLYFRPWDHQLIRPMLVVRGKPPAGGNRYDVLDVVRKVPARSADLDAVFGSKADVGCTMGEP